MSPASAGTSDLQRPDRHIETENVSAVWPKIAAISWKLGWTLSRHADGLASRLLGFPGSAAYILRDAGYRDVPDPLWGTKPHASAHEEEAHAGWRSASAGFAPIPLSSYDGDHDPDLDRPDLTYPQAGDDKSR